MGHGFGDARGDRGSNAVTEPLNEPVKVHPIADVIAAIRARGPRYLGVTVGNLIYGQLFLLFVQWLMPDNRRAAANAITVILCAIPTYYLHRRWVWEKKGRSSLRTEIVPFWLFVLLGLVASTLAVAAVQALWTNTFDGPLPALVTNLVNIATFTVIWAVRFLWMDKAFGVEREP